MLTAEQTALLETLAQGLSVPPRLPVLRRPDEIGLDYTPVQFSTADGVTLSGWFMPGRSGHVIVSNHFSPGNKYGFAGHLDGLGFAGGFEVNFLPRYKALVEAGYSVLAYDQRGHGDSSDGPGGISGVGALEWQDLLAALDYLRGRGDVTGLSLFTMCMGANAAINAMARAPGAFADVSSMIAIAPLKGRTTIARHCARAGIDPAAGLAAFAPRYHALSGLRVEDHDITEKARAICVPTFFVQLREDMNSRWQDVQEMADLTPVETKVLYIEDIPWRFHGYRYFSDHPEMMLDWFNAHP